MSTASELRGTGGCVSLGGGGRKPGPCSSLAVSYATRREKLAIVGAQAFSLRRKGFSVGSIAYGLGVSTSFIYRALAQDRRMHPESGTVSAQETLPEANK